MVSDIRTGTREKILAAVCWGIVCCVLVAGLWPFHAPKNHVTWLPDQNGLHFEHQGSILSSREFTGNVGIGDESRTLEIWLKASQPDSSNAILGFYNAAKPFELFSLRQYRGSLVLQHESLDEQDHATTSWLGVDDVIRQEKFVFVTITTGAKGTTVYADGLPVEVSSSFRLSASDFSGRLVLGNSAVVDDSWSGEVRGLAIYGRGLTSTQVLRHFEEWTKNGRPEFVANEAPIAIYLFNERSGNVVHNQLDPATHLLVPNRFFVLHHGYLQAPWKEFDLRWSYLKDVCINIAGFVPLGFFFCAYLSFARRSRSEIAATVLCGFTVSLTIELLQALLPTRDSGITDIITNTLGTGLGAILCKYSLARSPFLKRLYRNQAF